MPTFRWTNSLGLATPTGSRLGFSWSSTSGVFSVLRDDLDKGFRVGGNRCSRCTHDAYSESLTRGNLTLGTCFDVSLGVSTGTGAFGLILTPKMRYL